MGRVAKILKDFGPADRDSPHRARIPKPLTRWRTEGRTQPQHSTNFHLHAIVETLITPPTGNYGKTPLPSTSFCCLGPAFIAVAIGRCRYFRGYPQINFAGRLTRVGQMGGQRPRRSAVWPPATGRWRPSKPPSAVVTEPRCGCRALPRPRA